VDGLAPVSRIREFLKLAGKRGHTISAVFGTSPGPCAAAVRYLRRGAPEAPVWLFSTTAPDPDTAALCESVCVLEDPIALLVEAEKQLWPHWVGLTVATWTGERGAWPVKLAPFLIPPFRTLFMNEQEDYFSGSPGAVLKHVNSRVRDDAISCWNRLLDIDRGIWLWVFALFAQNFAPLSRWAFRKWHGHSPLAVTALPGAGGEIAVFQYRGRYWNWHELLRLAQESTARYVLFQMTKQGAPVADLLPLFSGERTFAVSRQVDYRDWKQWIFTMAAFRALQPGEAAQTLAPVSDLLLVDRRKLLALGIPKTIVPGTAWLLLFWKAAAAGWRSYSVHGAREIGAEIGPAPDWPYEEAEFVTRVLADPQLRALGPVEPDLSRGNIVFAIGRNRNPSDRRSVLVVSPYLPYPLSHGGAVRIYNLCRTLGSRVDFLLACFREKNDTVHYDKLHEVFREVYVIDRDEKAVRDLALPEQVRSHLNGSMRALIANLCREGRADLLQVEFTHMAHFRDAAPRTPAILVEHDLTFTLYRQFAARNPGRAATQEYERWLAYERQWLPRYEAVWTMSEEDRKQAIAEGSPAGGSIVVANGVDLARFVPAPPAQELEVFYVGSFRHRPNIIGFEKLRHEVMPLVWQRFGAARLRVVAGPDPEQYWRSFQHRDYPRELDPRIRMHAFVEDLRPLYAKASVVAVPLEVSAGTNIKVMEAMACGRAVVSTPVGCQGLDLVDGCDALIRSTPQDFAAAICDLLGDPARREAIAAAARRTVEQRFSWDAIAERAHADYLQLLP
jgi:glycosyltransferase involved in cell wall biosynthesis